jgi:hypothetical protein
MSGYVAISGQITNVPQGTALIGPLTIAPSSSNFMSVLNVVLGSGANTIAVPSWASGVLIQPPSGNGVALTLKGVTGDTGIPISETGPTLLSFTTATIPSSFVITAASLTTGDTTITFF